eukprot:7033030-Prymnesium_polylepis.2
MSMNASHVGKRTRREAHTAVHAALIVPYSGFNVMLACAARRRRGHVVTDRPTCDDRSSSRNTSRLSLTL